MNKTLMLILVCMAMTLSPVIALSQEEEPNYSSGTVAAVKTDSNEIVISEYDWESDEEIKITYSIHPDIEVEDIDSWQNIPVGSYADIEYIIDKNGKKVATYISIYEPEEIE